MEVTLTEPNWFLEKNQVKQFNVYDMNCLILTLCATEQKFYSIE